MREYLTWTNVLIALGVLSALATLINGRLPRDAEGNPTRPKSWWQFYWMLLVDVLSWVPQPGKAGLFGRLPFNLPVMPSHTPPQPAGMQLPDEGVKKIEVGR
jgi:hypothetical protein